MFRHAVHELRTGFITHNAFGVYVDFFRVAPDVDGLDKLAGVVEVLDSSVKLPVVVLGIWLGLVLFQVFLLLSPVLGADCLAFW